MRSCCLLFEEPLIRLRDFIKEHGDPKDKLASKALDYLYKQIAKFDPSSYRASRIGVRAIEAIFNYVGTHRQALSDAGTFHLELTEKREEMYADCDYELTSG